MIGLVLAGFDYVRAYLVSRHQFGLEAAALRQQLVVFKRKQPRPRLGQIDRFFWLALRRIWSGWAGALIIVKAEIVVSWHRAGCHCSGASVPAASAGPKSASKSGS